MSGDGSELIYTFHLILTGQSSALPAPYIAEQPSTDPVSIRETGSHVMHPAKSIT
jgi:hypothetical protein